MTNVPDPDDRAERTPFSMSIDVAAPRDAVWRAISEADELRRWFAPVAEVEPGPGGRVLWEWPDHHSWPQTIEVWEPGQHLRTRYDSPVDDGHGGRRPLFMDFHLEGDAGTTTLRIVHSGFGPEAGFDAEYDGISHGWPVELRSLRLYLERHRGVDRSVAWTARPVAGAAAAAWRALVGPDGLDAAGLGELREGEPFALEVPGAGRVTGTALHSPTQFEFTGIAENLGGGWLRVGCEQCRGGAKVWLWLALYGRPERETAAFQKAFDALAERPLGAAGSAR